MGPTGIDRLPTTDTGTASVEKLLYSGGDAADSAGMNAFLHPVLMPTP